MDFLQNVRVKSIGTLKAITTVEPSHSIKEAMNILRDNGITSAPIFDSKIQKIVGNLTVMDLVAFMVATFFKNKENHPSLYDTRELEERFNLPIREALPVLIMRWGLRGRTWSF